LIDALRIRRNRGHQRVHRRRRRRIGQERGRGITWDRRNREEKAAGERISGERLLWPGSEIGEGKRGGRRRA
jgi:hypothetical protein